MHANPHPQEVPLRSRCNSCVIPPFFDGSYTTLHRKIHCLFPFLICGRPYEVVVRGVFYLPASYDRLFDRDFPVDRHTSSVCARVPEPYRKHRPKCTEFFALHLLHVASVWFFGAGIARASGLHRKTAQEAVATVMYAFRSTSYRVV